MPYTPCGHTCYQCGQQCTNNYGHEGIGASHSCGHS